MIEIYAIENKTFYEYPSQALYAVYLTFIGLQESNK